MYADEGELRARRCWPTASRVTLADRGRGIPDLESGHAGGVTPRPPPRCAQRGFGAGLGLPNIRRNSDEFAIESTVGVGTTLRYAVRFAI